MSAIASLLAGSLGILTGRWFVRLPFKRLQVEPESYAQRLSSLTGDLVKASQQVHSVLSELAQVARLREATGQRLEADLKGLEEREKQLRRKIEHLEKVPLPVADYFAEMSKQGEKRSAWRDYMLFGGGVVVSTVIAIVLKLVGLA